MAVQKSAPKRRTRGSLSQEEILRAALDILTEQGPEHLTMRAIARKLECSVASPYAYFESQDEILRTLIRRGEDRLTSLLRRAQASSEDVFEQLEAIARTYWQFAADSRELHRVMFSTGSGTAYRRVFPSLPTSYRVFLETIRRGINTGAIPFPRSAYRSIAETMWAWMYGLIILEMTDMLRAARTGRDPIADGVALFQDMLRNGPRPGTVFAQHAARYNHSAHHDGR